MEKIVIVAATGFEVAPLFPFLQKYNTGQPFNFQFNNKEIKVLITGAGITFTAFALGKFYATNKVDWAINMGIAGSFRKDWELGKVVNVIEDRFGDFGVELADGNFSSIFELDWMDKDQYPFENGILKNKLSLPDLYTARGLTVNKVHGSEATIKKLNIHEFDIESMEGAAFFYASFLEKIPCYQIRSISNYVENRNKSNWEIGIAIENLNTIMIDYLSK